MQGFFLSSETSFMNIFGLLQLHASMAGGKAGSEPDPKLLDEALSQQAKVYQEEFAKLVKQTSRASSGLPGLQGLPGLPGLPELPAGLPFFPGLSPATAGLFGAAGQKAAGVPPPNAPPQR